jgi:formylglycine-generating enzyme required for sulfatase activity
VRADKPFDAIGLLNTHVLYRYNSLRTIEPEIRNLINKYCDFLTLDILKDNEFANFASGHGLFAQGIAAKCLQALEKKWSNDDRVNNELKDAVHKVNQCFINRINNLRKDEKVLGEMSVSQLWDLTSTLVEIEIPDLERVFIDKRDTKGADAYFANPTGKIQIGSDKRLTRVDEKKWLEPYHRQEVELPEEVYVARYLVTVREYKEFHDACKPVPPNYHGQVFFDGPGKLWFKKDRDLLSKIKDHFELTKGRCLDCERGTAQRDQRAVRAVGDFENRMLRRALRECEHSERIWLKGESLYRHDRLPVVDVNWWEATAYCKWFSENKLRQCGFDPSRFEVGLLPDWMWEAIRVLGTDQEDREVTSTKPDDFFGHIKRGDNVEPGRVGHLCFPIHVGLFASRNGMYSMAGNVWEWTASPSFAEIKRIGPWEKFARWLRSKPDGASDPSEFTSWRCPKHDRDPQHKDRSIEGHPLQMRLLRGGSFMSHPQYAWGTCMRMCDPPYYSFQDVGFRIAVFRRT